MHFYNKMVMLSTKNNNNVESFKAMIWSSKPWNNINDVVINIIGKFNKIFDFKKITHWTTKYWF